MDANKGESIAMGRGAAWAIAVVFLLMIVGPGYQRHSRELQKAHGWIPVIELFRYTGPTLSDHLAAFEKRLAEDSEFATRARQWAQGVMTRVFREGNRKVLIGLDGWLYYRPELESMTGESPWERRINVIRRFEEQLEAMGVELILVDVPAKSVVYPEGLNAGEGPLGIDTVPGLPAAMNADRSRAFLQQDTHWSPEGMEAAVRQAAEEIRARRWFSELELEDHQFRIEEVRASAHGDLVGMLGLVERQKLFKKEAVTVRRVIDVETGKPVALNDQESPIVLLGDSSVNIYGNESLGFGSGGGLGHHLARELGMPLDVIAINGQGATGVRRVLANRPGSARMMREKKKAVIWITAAREIWMAEDLAREEGVVWENVSFNERAVDTTIVGEIVVDAQLTMKSRIPDPGETPYADAIFSAIYEVDGVVSGEYANGEVRVFHWAFQDKQLSQASRYRVGERQRLRLVPLTNKEGERSMNRCDDFSDRFDLTELWAEEVTAVTE